MNLYYEITKLRYEFSGLIPEPDIWTNDSVFDFFQRYREIVTKMIVGFPKFRFNGVFVFAGMDEDQLPFMKELIQAKIYNVLFDSDIILLPRYIDRIFMNIFNVDLRKGSLGDGLAAYNEDGRYIEFKLCADNKLPQRITEASTNSDEFFICIYNLQEETIRKLRSQRLKVSLKEGKHGKLFCLDSMRLFEIQNIEERIILSEYQGLRLVQEQPILSLSKWLIDIDRWAFIPYKEYLLGEKKYWQLNTFLLYGGNISIPECIEEYKSIRRILARKNIRAVIPKSSLISLFDFPFTGVIEFFSETGTVFDKDVSARTLADIRGLQYLKISNTELFLT